MRTHMRSIWRSGLAIAALVAVGAVLAPPAFATEDPGVDPPGTEVVTPPASEPTLIGGNRDWVSPTHGCETLISAAVA
jgi:hypothetical protein